MLFEGASDSQLPKQALLSIPMGVLSATTTPLEPRHWGPQSVTFHPPQNPKLHTLLQLEVLQLSWKKGKGPGLKFGLEIHRYYIVKPRDLSRKPRENLAHACRVTPYRTDLCVSRAGGLCQVHGFQNEFPDYGHSGPFRVLAQILRFTQSLKTLQWVVLRETKSFVQLGLRSHFRAAFPSLPVGFQSIEDLIFNMKFLHCPLNNQHEHTIGTC